MSAPLTGDEEDIDDLLADDPPEPQGCNSDGDQEHHEQEGNQQYHQNDESESEDDGYTCLIDELPPRLIRKSTIVGKVAHDDTLLFKYFTDLEIIQVLTDQFLVRVEENYVVVFNDNSLPDDFYRKMMAVKHPSLIDTKQVPYMTFDRFKRDIMTGFRYWSKQANCILESAFLGGFIFHEVQEWLKKMMVPARPALFYQDSFKTLGRSVNFVKQNNKPLPPMECAELAKIAQADDGLIDRKEAERMKPTPPVYTVSEDLNEEEFFNVVRSHLRTQEVQSKLKGSLKFPLVLTLLKLLAGFPFGAVPLFLNEEFERQMGYRVEYEHLGFEAFEELFTENDHVFRVVKKGNLFLVFPYWRTDRIDIDAVKMQLLHWLAVLARSKKSDDQEIRLDDVTAKLEGYRFPFKPQAWGVDSHELFYRTFLVEYDPNRSFVRAVRKTCYDDQMIKYYFTLEQPEKVKKVEPVDPPQQPLRRIQVSSAVPRRVTVPSGLPEGDQWLKENVHPLNQPLPSRKFKRRFTDVQMDRVFSPALFYVTELEDVERKEDFFDRMTIAYNNLQSSDPAKFDSLTVPRELLEPGAIVVKKIETEGWQRLQIKSLGKNHAKALLIDYGDFEDEVTLDDLKYLLKEWAVDSPYSLCCTLRQKYLAQFIMTKKSSFPTYDFAPYVGDIFWELAIGGTFSLELSKEIEPNLYEVHLHFYSQEEDRWENVMHILFDVIRRSLVANGKPGVERMYRVDFERKKKRKQGLENQDEKELPGYDSPVKPTPIQIAFSTLFNPKPANK